MPSAYTSDAAADRSPVLPEPTRPPLTFRGRKVTPAHVLDLWKRAMQQRQRSRSRILACREFRRMADETLIKLNPKWARANPEGEDWVVETLEERKNLDSNMVARVGVVEPEIGREPLGFTQRDRDLAEECEAYLEEHRRRNIPTQAFFGKGTEDGEYARVTLPAECDMDGCPTFFETLDERAYRMLDDAERKGYAEDDEAGRRGRTRYVKTDDRGEPVVRERYRPEPLTKDEDALPAQEKQAARDRKERAGRDRHLDDVRRYLLDKPASNTRVIPALDCAPIFARGRDRNRWELVALVERTLYYVEELIEQEYAWAGLGDRLAVPLAYDADGHRLAPSDVGDGGQFYLYTAYLVCKDDEGHRRPVIAYTVGGASTSWGTGSNPDDPDEVGLLDLYEEYGLEGPLWSYHGGFHSEDDDPDHYWEPYLWRFLRRIRAIEGNKTAINAATQVSSFPGQYYRPDAAAMALENADDFLLDTDGELRQPKVARTGELLPVVGEIFNAPPPQIGGDAWRQLQMDLQSLQAAMAMDQAPAPSGSGAAQLVQQTISQVAKRHIREGALDAVVRSAEDHLKIVDAIYRKHGVRWPIQTVEERPVGEENRAGVVPAEYDPRWIGEGNFRLKAAYPEEENLARIDLEASLAERGFGSSERVYKAMGERDSERARLNADRDRLLKAPAADALRMVRVAKKLGDRELLQIAKLQAQQLLAPQTPPGFEGGIPTDALKRRGESGGGGPPIASSIRGGIQAGQVYGDTMAANADAAMTQTGSAA